MRAEGGGYSRPICLVPMPSVGYNVPFLKEMVGASTLIYIRPMKSTISMEKAHDTSTTSTSPATECTRCAKKVPISNLRQHNLECKHITIDTGEESQEEEDRLANEVIPVVDDGEGPSSQTWSSQLKLLFSDAEIEYLEEIACQVTSLDEAAGYVLH